MGLTTALFTALSGINTNSTGVNVTGNNIANANTIAFKAGRAIFETQISQTLSPGTAPTANSGGTNQAQIGLGVRMGEVTRNYVDGSLQTTGSNTDLAIEGAGFFVVNLAGKELYTRAGSFTLNSNFNLVNPEGALLQGYGIDQNFNVVEGVLTDVKIPLGAMTVAEATRNVEFKGNLNSGGEVATSGTIITSNPLTDVAAGGVATATSLLTDLQDAGGNSLFAAGDVITLSQITKGEVTLQDRTFEIGTSTTSADAFGTTLQDFMDFVNEVIGIDEDADPTAGITVTGAGEIQVRGNTGTVNNIGLVAGNIIVNRSSSNPTLPFNLTTNQEADGESVRTSFTVFDSLGTNLQIDLTVVLESKSNAGTSWRYYVQSEDDSDVDRAIGTGLLTFGPDGRALSAGGQAFSIDREDTGAETPQVIQMNFNNGSAAISALADSESVIRATSQDGSALGTLSDFTVGDDGRVVGTFSNSLQRTLGQVVLSTFVNPQGLSEISGNLFTTSASSGTASIGKPTIGGVGRTVSGALELSNVDLSQEFINLVIYSTGFSANSRVLTTGDRLIQELLATVR